MGVPTKGHKGDWGQGPKELGGTQGGSSSLSYRPALQGVLQGSLVGLFCVLPLRMQGLFSGCGLC